MSIPTLDLSSPLNPVSFFPRGPVKGSQRPTFPWQSSPCWPPDWPLMTVQESNEVEVRVPQGRHPHLGHTALLTGSCGRGLHLFASLGLFLPLAGKTILTLQCRGWESGTDPFVPGVYTTSALAAGLDASEGSLGPAPPATAAACGKVETGIGPLSWPTSYSQVTTSSRSRQRHTQTM